MVDDDLRPDRDEAREIDQVIVRLADRFPTVDRERVELIVHDEARILDGGRVRDFVPVLVEHAARDRLRLEAEPAPLDVVAEEERLVPSDDPTDLDPMEVERRSRGKGLYLGELDN